MTTTHLRPRLGARTVSAAVLSTAMLVGPALAGVTAATAAEPTSRAVPTCQQVWDAMPDALRDDVTAAISLDRPQQRRAMRAIRYAALHGAYGDRVQTWAMKVRERRIELWKSFPEALKEDVRAARSLPPREQRRAIAAIRYAAMNGTYGDRVQRLAEERRAWLVGCPTPARAFEATEDLGIG